MWLVTKTRLFKQFSNKHSRAEAVWKIDSFIVRLTRDRVLRLSGPVKISSITPGETSYQISREVFKVYERQEMETSEI